MHILTKDKADKLPLHLTAAGVTDLVLTFIDPDGNTIEAAQQADGSVTMTSQDKDGVDIGDPFTITITEAKDKHYYASLTPTQVNFYQMHVKSIAGNFEDVTAVVVKAADTDDVMTKVAEVKAETALIKAEVEHLGPVTGKLLF